MMRNVLSVWVSSAELQPVSMIPVDDIEGCGAILSLQCIVETQSLIESLIAPIVTIKGIDVTRQLI